MEVGKVLCLCNDDRADVAAGRIRVMYEEQSKLLYLEDTCGRTLEIGRYFPVCKSERLVKGNAMAYVGRWLEKMAKGGPCEIVIFM